MSAQNPSLGERMASADQTGCERDQVQESWQEGMLPDLCWQGIADCRTGEKGCKYGHRDANAYGIETAA